MVIEEAPSGFFSDEDEERLKDMSPEQREAYIGDILHFNKWIADPEKKNDPEFSHIIKDLETSNLSNYEIFNCYYDLELIDLIMAYRTTFPKSMATCLRDLYGYMALSKSKGGTFMKALTTRYNVQKQELEEIQSKGNGWGWGKGGKE